MTTETLLTQYLQPEIGEDEKRVKDAFCKEYLYDNNAIAACMRIGFMQPFASQFAKQFMNEAYVWWKLRQLTSDKDADDEQAQNEEVNFIKQSLIRESNYHGADSSHGARVQALGKLVAIRGMEQPKKTEVEVTHKGGVMLIPPMANIEQWEDDATASQEKLINASAID